MSEQRDVVGLQRLAVSIHIVAKRGVHKMLNGRHAAVGRLQRHRNRAALTQAIGDAAIRTDVGAAETVDGLFRIADDKQRAGTELPVVSRGEATQEIRLQRIGILELVDEDVAESIAESAADVLVVADQIARLDQEIEKIERAGLLLPRFVEAQALAHLLMQKGGKVGVDIGAKGAQLLEQLRVRGQDLVACHTDCERGSRPLLRIRKIPVVGKRHERGLPPVPHAVGHHVADHSLLALDVGARGARLSEGHGQAVVSFDRFTDQIGKRLEARDVRLDRRGALVRRAPPRCRVIAPLAQVAGGGAQTLDRSVFCFVAKAPLDGPTQRTPHTLLRIAELRVEPRRKRFFKDAFRLRVGQHHKRRIDPRFDGPFAQQLGAEAVDGADLRFFEVVHGGVEQAAGV